MQRPEAPVSINPCAVTTAGIGFPEFCNAVALGMLTPIKNSYNGSSWIIHLYHKVWQLDL